MKFGAVRPGSNAAKNFDLLLDACEAMAADKGMSRLMAGINMARHRAYKKMLERGFKIDILGISMHRPNESGYSRSEVFIIDDWR